MRRFLTRDAGAKSNAWMLRSFLEEFKTPLVGVYGHTPLNFVSLHTCRLPTIHRVQDV